jgi:hypothetical protein
VVCQTAALNEKAAGALLDAKIKAATVSAHAALCASADVVAAVEAKAAELKKANAPARAALEDSMGWAALRATAPAPPSAALPTAAEPAPPAAAELTVPAVANPVALSAPPAPLTAPSINYSFTFLNDQRLPQTVSFRTRNTTLFSKVANAMRQRYFPDCSLKNIRFGLNGRALDGENLMSVQELGIKEGSQLSVYFTLY